jgi:hypothetical protein
MKVILCNRMQPITNQQSGRSDLIMKIACSRSVTVQTVLEQYRPDTALFRKESQRYFGRWVAQLSVQTPSAIVRTPPRKIFQTQFCSSLTYK